MTDSSTSTNPAGEGPAGLVGDVLTGFTKLVQGEISLAKAEFNESLTNAISGAVKIVIGAVLAITGLNVLAGAAVAILVTLGMSATWATLIVGVALLGLAAVLVMIGLRSLKPSNLAPTRTIRSLRKDVETIKPMVTPGGTADIKH